jgi:hypothetical protein
VYIIDLKQPLIEHAVKKYARTKSDVLYIIDFERFDVFPLVLGERYCQSRKMAPPIIIK